MTVSLKQWQSMVPPDDADRIMDQIWVTDENVMDVDVDQSEVSAEDKVVTEMYEGHDVELD
jgi:hypothetical protein